MNFLKTIFNFITCKKKKVATVHVKKEIKEPKIVCEEPKIECCNKVEESTGNLNDRLTIEMTIDSKPIDSREVELEIFDSLSNDLSNSVPIVESPKIELSLDPIPLPLHLKPSAPRKAKSKNVKTQKKNTKKPAKKVNKKRGKK